MSYPPQVIMETTNFSILNALAAEIGEKRVLQMANAYIKHIQMKRDGIAPWAPRKRVSRQNSLESISPRRLDFQEPFPNQVFSDTSF